MTTRAPAVLKSYFDISNVYNMIRLLRSANHEDLVICVKPWWIGRLPKDQKCCLIPEPNNEPKEKRNIFDVKISLFFWCFSDLPGVFGFVVKLVEIYAWLSLFWYTCVATASSLARKQYFENPRQHCQYWQCQHYHHQYIQHHQNCHYYYFIKDKDSWELP